MKDKKLFLIGAILMIAFVLLAWLCGAWMGLEIASQLFAAIAGAIIAAIITMLLLHGQTANEEKKDRNIKIYENKISVYSQFVSSMWKTLEDEEMTKEEWLSLRSGIFNQLIFYVNPKNLEEIQKVLKNISEEAKQPEKFDENLYKKGFTKITKILKIDLENSVAGDELLENNNDKIMALWNSFANMFSSEDFIASSETADERIRNEQSSAHSDTPDLKMPESPITFNGQFWHFNMWGIDQLNAIKNGKFELSLVEYGENWRTNLIKQVKEGDIVFLFRRGGWGYVGAYRVLGRRIMNFDDNSEEIVLNGKRDFRNLIPEKDIADYDFYKSKDDGADYCSNLIVEQLAYYDKGVSYPGGVYRRTISRYDYNYACTLLSRLLTSSKDEANFGKLNESDGVSNEMRCNMDEFHKLVKVLDIKPAVKGPNGNWI